MKKIIIASLVMLAMVPFAGTAVAKESVLTGARVGFAIDRGFGVIGTFKQFNLFVGNDGVAFDYVFKRQPWHTSLKGPVNWYLGGGIYGDWDGERGVRVPVGADWHFAQDLDAYAQLNPYLRVNHHAEFGLDLAFGIRYKF